MQTENKRTISDFTEGSVIRKMTKFMLPILGAWLLQAMYGAVDMLVVGKFGTQAGISAVATGGNIINLVTAIIISLTMGLTILISRYLGERRPERIGDAIGGGIIFFALFAVFAMVVLLLGAPLWAALLNAPEEAFSLTLQYIRICGAGMIFVVAYNVISGIFRGMGNSRLPLLFVAIACCVNIVGDLFFVAVLHLDVAGAAIATVLAQAVSVLVSLVIIRRQPLPFTVSRRNICFNRQITRFLKLGLPLALQELLTNISFLAVLAIVNHLGLDQSSGYGIAQKIVQFIMIIPAVIMQSMSAFVGQNVGAGREGRAKQSMLTGMAMGCSIGLVVSLLAIFFGEPISMLFTNSAVFAQQSALYLKGFALEAVLTSIVLSFSGYFNGHGNTLPVMIEGISAAFLFRIPLSYLFSLRQGASLLQIGLAVPLSSVYGIVFFVIVYGVFQRRARGRKEQSSFLGGQA